MSFHSQETGLSLHQNHAFTFTSASNLSAGTPSAWNGSSWVTYSYTFTSADEGKIALLLGDGGATQFGTSANTFYVCLVVNGVTPTFTVITSSGSESSGINYITNGLASQGNTNGWMLYADTPGPSPVSGGGSPGTGITFVTSTSSPLRGAYDFLLSRPASNKQGQGVRFDFTIDPADQATVLSVSFDYSAVSGTFAGGTQAPGTITPSDITVWIYDITNSQLIQVAPYVLVGNQASQYHFKGVFQTASNSTSYRLIFHCGTTNTTAFGLTIDNVQVGPQIQVLGPAFSDWQSFVMTITGSISNPTKATSPTVDAAAWRRSGDSMEIVYSYRSNAGSGGSAGSGTYKFQLPSGYSIDFTKVTQGAESAGLGVVGSCSAINGSANFDGVVCTDSSTSVALYIGNDSIALAFLGSSNIPLNAESWLTFIAKVPIVGWSSNVLMSSDTDTRTVAMNATNVGGTLNASTNDVTWSTIVKDSHGAMGSTSYTVPVSGFYYIDAYARMDATYSLGNDAELSININGSSIYFGLDRAGGAQVSLFPHVTAIAFLNSGNTIKIQSSNAGSGPTYTSQTTYAQLSIFRLSGPSVIAATEQVAAVYQANSNTSITNGVDVPVDFLSKEIDTHGAVNNVSGSWKFTAPISGNYRVGASVTFGATENFSSGSYVKSILYKNGVYQAMFDNIPILSTLTSVRLGSLFGAYVVALNAGDYIQIMADHQESSARTVTYNSIATAETWVAIERLKN